MVNLKYIKAHSGVLVESNLQSFNGGGQESIKRVGKESHQRMRKKRKIILIVSSLFIALLCFHQFSIEADDKDGYKITDIRIYKDTPAWELALAVKRQRIRTIMKIVEKKPDLLNYQDPKYGATEAFSIKRTVQS